MFRILVIDDDPTTQLVLKRTLRNQGYDVATAQNGQDGLDQLRTFRPALIICDWMMPGMDGLEVCQHVKADSTFSTTFFILLTAKGAVEDRVRGLDTGADDFLAKPIEINELLARVRAGLRLHQLSEAIQIQKQRLESELAEAAGYVRSLLPLPLRGQIYIDAQFIPSRQLGGDCFDYYWLDEDHLVIYLVDVSGHGVGSALLSVSILNLLRWFPTGIGSLERRRPRSDQGLSGINYRDPSEVLSVLNDRFPMGEESEKYFTMWYGVYNQETHQLVYASAGHPAALLLSKTTDGTVQIQKLQTPGLPVGMFPDAEFTTQFCRIESPSTLYIFSDGIYEIQQPDGTLWGYEAFAEFLAHCTRQGICRFEDILQHAQQINGSAILEDDLSLVKIDFPAQALA